MNRLLRDLYYHQAWADAEYYKALESSPSALGDALLRNRLHHYHYTQHAFLWLAEATGKPFRRTNVEDFKTIAELKEYARDFNTAASRFLNEVPGERLQETIAIPWAPEHSQPITVELALTQAAMHSHHHRAQIAFGEFDSDPINKELYPDQETFKKEEQRRFEILLGHWDLPVNPLDLEKK